jgi:hypothetical protein
MDSRLLALGSVAVIAAAGFVRKGSCADPTPWLHKDVADRYVIQVVVRSDRDFGEWIVPEESAESGSYVLGTAPTRQEAKNVVEKATEFGHKMLDVNPVCRDRLASSGGVGHSSPYEIWIRLYDQKTTIVDFSSFVAGYDDDVLALLLHAEIVDRWPKQRVSFRTFAPPQDSP